MMYIAESKQANRFRIIFPFITFSQSTNIFLWSSVHSQLQTFIHSKSNRRDEQKIWLVGQVSPSIFFQRGFIGNQFRRLVQKQGNSGDDVMLREISDRPKNISKIILPRSSLWIIHEKIIPPRIYMKRKSTDCTSLHHRGPRCKFQPARPQYIFFSPRWLAPHQLDKVLILPALG